MEKESGKTETEAEKWTERMMQMGRTKTWRIEGRSVGGVGKNFVNSFWFATKVSWQNDKKDKERKERKSEKTTEWGTDW